MPLLRRKSDHRSSCIIYSLRNMERPARMSSEVVALQDLHPIGLPQEESSHHPLLSTFPNTFETLDLSETLDLTLGMDIQLESGRDAPLTNSYETSITELHGNGTSSTSDLMRPILGDDSVIVIPDSPPPSPGAVIDLCSSPEPGDPATPPQYEPRDSLDKNGSLKCPICLCSLFDGDVQPIATKCGHIYCQPCISETFQTRKKCPICRKTLKKREFIPLYFNPCRI